MSASEPGLASGRRGLARISDLAVVAGVVVVVALIVLPVPAAILDALIAANIALGITLLLVSIYISSPTEFPVFPSILLIGTVFRLALSIAATRMILTTGHAGSIIDTFGALAAAGNLVVGLVVFLVITLVQFIVIAKGAERVGEVSARFSLDAMPGKQMSIDSDLRSGLIDKDEARRRRRLLELESRLHGSLDGAMKFIKGDAIAGIVILLINLIGGFAVGVLQRGLSAAEAMHTYSVLTVGDGMVTQIPALLFALAAGLVVTRTTADGAETHLGEAIRQQLSGHPRVPLVAGVLCALLALVPGFPAPWFLALALIGVAAGVRLDPKLWSRARRAAVQRGWVAADASSETAGKLASPAVAALRPLHLQVKLVGQVLPPSTLEALLWRLQAEFGSRLGLTLPEISFEVAPGQGRSEWRLLLFETPVGGGFLDGPEPAAQLAHGLGGCLRRQAGGLLGLQEVSTMIQKLSETHPDLTREVLRVLSPVRVTEVLRALVEEEVSLRRLPAVLEALADAGQKERDAAPLIALVRVAIHSTIVAPYVRGGELRAIALDPRLEQRLRGSDPVGATIPQLPLGPAAAQALIAALRSEAEETGAAVLIAPIDLRRQLRKLIEPELFDLPVLAYNELRPPLRLNIIGRVHVGELAELAA